MIKQVHVLGRARLGLIEDLFYGDDEVVEETSPFDQPTFATRNERGAYVRTVERAEAYEGFDPKSNESIGFRSHRTPNGDEIGVLVVRDESLHPVTSGMRKPTRNIHTKNLRAFGWCDIRSCVAREPRRAPACRKTGEQMKSTYQGRGARNRQQ